jgi:hypothetical protein
MLPTYISVKLLLRGTPFLLFECPGEAENSFLERLLPSTNCSINFENLDSQGEFSPRWGRSIESCQS